MSVKGPRYIALQNGDRFYTSDKPCKLGHIALRVSNTGTCTECRKLKDRIRYSTNPEKAKLRSKNYVEKNKSKVLAARKEYYKLNTDKEKAVALARSREWRKLNPNHEGSKLSKLEYKNTAKGKATASKNTTQRRTGLKQATPLWADMVTIGDVYMEASYMQMQVDHIVPLRNKLVCGLHTWDNMQLLTSLENNVKGNRHWPDMPS